MPSVAEIQLYLTGAWRLMLGRADGLRLLDISADGFWNSFFAIVVALPAFGVGWVGLANELGTDPAVNRLSVVARIAVVDLGAWLLPLALLAVVARPGGVGDRFVHYVVASNWASAIVVWLMVPAGLMRLFAPGAPETISLVSLGLFGITLVLTWRLTNAVIGKGPAMGTAVFAGMLLASLVVLLGLESLLGIYIPA